MPVPQFPADFILSSEALNDAFEAVENVVAEQLDGINGRVEAIVTEAIGGITLGQFTPAGTGAVSRPVGEKLREGVSVTDYHVAGAEDWTPAFTAAAAVSNNVIVPPGTYLFSGPVDTKGRQISWLVADGAVFPAGSFALRGSIIRARRINRNTWGTYDQAAGFAVCLHGDPDRQAAVLGLPTDPELSTYENRDSVAIYADNIAPPPVHITAGTTYTATTITFTNPVDPTLLKVGMIIDTRHNPKYSGRIVSWSGNTITVSGWYRVGISAPGQIPQNGIHADVGAITSIWAMNANVSLYPNSTAKIGHAFEVGTINDQAAFNPVTQYPRLVAYDAVAFGQFGSWVGYYSRGPYYDGFRAQGAVRAGFSVENHATGPEFGFLVERANCTPIEHRPDGFLHCRMTATGNLEIGRRDIPWTPYIDFHSAGADSDFGARIMAQGGIAGVSGTADLVVNAANVITTNIMPGTNNLYSLGSGGARYATINTYHLNATSIQVGDYTANPRSIDFNVTGFANDYDVRLLAQGGVDGTSGLGDLIVSASHLVTTNIQPGTPGIYSIGTAALPYATIHGQAVLAQGQMVIGNGEPVTRTLDFRTSGFANVFDARLEASGGLNEINGAANLRLVASSVTLPNILPTSPYSSGLGNVNNGFSQVWALSGYFRDNLQIGTGTIGTRYIDFRSTSGSQNYDARISVDGGVPNVNNGGTIHLTANRTTAELFLPALDNTYSLGAASFRWSDAWVASGVIQTSDATDKRDVKGLTGEEAEKLVMSIPARTFRWKDGVRRHTGFVAQEVESAVQAAGITTEDFAGLIIDKDTGAYGLRMEQIYALLWPVVQGLLRRDRTKADRIAALEKRIAALEA